MRNRLAAALAVAALAMPAQAEWLRASSRHFVIYSDTRSDEITRLATRLERVDAAMRFIQKIEDTPEAAANPVTVYVLDDTSAIRRLARRPNIGGFYLGRADGAVAFTPRRGDGAGVGALEPQIVLFHEYAHHFLLSNFDAAFPAWFAEGYAEFVSTAKVEEKTVVVGGGAQHRAWGLFADQALPMRTLFAPGPKLSPEQQDQLYGRGWLLTHYILFDPKRRETFREYLVKLNRGVPPLQAATEAFGDLNALGRSLDAYLRARTLHAFNIPIDKLPDVDVKVRPLSPGERALVEMRMVSTRGVDAKTAGPLHQRAARAAQPFGADAVAQGWLAEMAYDAGDDAAAEAAADRALAADPRSVQALLYKSRIRLRRAAVAKSTDATVWREARSWVVKANRIDTNAAGPLQLFYDSFGMEGGKPSASAVAGVHRALELAPQDEGLRFRSVSQRLTDGEVDEAKRELRPLAFSPHAGPDNPAAKLMALLDQGQAGPAALAAMAKAEEGKASE